MEENSLLKKEVAGKVGEITTLKTELQSLQSNVQSSRVGGDLDSSKVKIMQDQDKIGVIRKCVHDVFESFAEINCEGMKGIKLSKFKQALCTVRPEFHYLSEEEAKQLFVQADLENDEVLGEKEFTYALSKAFPVEQALSVLPLHRLIESSLPGFRHKHPNEHLEIFAYLSDAEIANMVAAVSPEIERLVREMVHGLREAKDRQDQNADDSAGAKFDIVTLSAGTIEDFHDGLQGRVGGDVFKRHFLHFLFSDPDDVPQ